MHGFKHGMIHPILLGPKSHEEDRSPIRNLRGVPLAPLTIDLLIGPRGSAAELAFANALVNNKDGFTTLLAVVAPNLLAKPNTILFNKVTIKGAKQAVQLFGPAQHGVAKAVADSVAEGIIPLAEADDLFISVGVFIHWDASDDKKIQDYNYQATKEALARAIRGEPKASEVVARRNDVKHPFAAN
jgi:5,6,7,8-tetrahydromethanopterin hydro-lyase